MYVLNEEYSSWHTWGFHKQGTVLWEQERAQHSPFTGIRTGPCQATGEEMEKVGAIQGMGREGGCAWEFRRWPQTRAH